MKLNRRIAALAALVLLAAVAGCSDATGPRLPDDGSKPDLPPPTGQTYLAPAAPAVYA
ncbi:MAG TPA: hypothetical protein VHG93_01575 [Longimicrobium sp.]|nr:hypothetical protein [Longimicrobium sp.]